MNPVVIPNVGVNLIGLATALIVSLGSVLAVVVAGMIAFIVVKRGINFIRGYWDTVKWYRGDYDDSDDSASMGFSDYWEAYKHYRGDYDED